jgi:ABC transport system ATP-binding/permease protein
VLGSGGRPDGGSEIIERDSHNGTFVNGERITRKLVTEQNVISIGHATFQLGGGLRQDADKSAVACLP